MRAVDDDANPNAPTRRQPLPRVPEGRHRAELMNLRSVRRSDVNTVIMPWVDVRQDVEDVRQGRAIPDGNTFTVNGRVYVLEPKGRLSPRRGDRFHQLSRTAYRALALYNDSGRDEDVERMLDLEDISEADRAIARRLVIEIREWRDRQ